MAYGDVFGAVMQFDEGQPNGIPTLDENGRVPLGQLPSIPTLDTEGKIPWVQLPNGLITQARWYSNPNLLDNWYFADPINQQGQTEYTGNVYTIDRWQGGQSGITVRVEDGYISCTGEGVNFQQFIQSNLAGQVISMSVLGVGHARLILGYVQNSAYQFPVAADMNQESIDLCTLTYRIPADAGSLTIFLQTSSGTARYYAVKLELGPVQTLAHKEGDTWVLNDPPPNKALELAKCQRYMYTPFTHFTGYGDIADGWVWQPTLALFMLHLPTMQRPPTFRVGDVTNFRVTAKTRTGLRNDIIPTAIIAPNSIGECVRLQANVDSSYGMEPGSPCNLWVDHAQGTIPLLFDANL